MPAAKNPQLRKAAPALETAVKIFEPASALLHGRREAGRTDVFGLARPRRFKHVPTHVVGVVNERRDYPRALLRLPLRLWRVAGRREPDAAPLRSVNISSSGVYFFSPKPLEPGTPVELQIVLVERPRGRGSVRMLTQAHVVRVVAAEASGLCGLGVAFDDITFHRDEAVPLRYQKP